MNYNDIKRVFSIWIYMNMDEGSMAYVHLAKDDILGSQRWEGGLDLLNIVMIGIADELPEHDDKYELHRLLSAVLSNEQDRKFNKMLSDAFGQFENQQAADEVYERNCRKLEYDAQNTFRDYIWEHTDVRTKEMCREPFQIKEYLDKACAEKIKIYREQLNIL